jgi:hypothetical protein
MVCRVRCEVGFDKNSGSQVALAEVQDMLGLWVALGAAVSPLSFSLHCQPLFFFNTQHDSRTG